MPRLRSSPVQYSEVSTKIKRKNPAKIKGSTAKIQSNKTMARFVTQKAAQLHLSIIGPGGKGIPTVTPIRNPTGRRTTSLSMRYKVIMRRRRTK